MTSQGTHDTNAFTVTAAQINATVGDIAGNTAKIKAAYLEAAAKGVDLVVTPELSITGYPLDDLVARQALLDAADLAVEELRQLSETSDTALLVGLPFSVYGIHNGVALIEKGNVEIVSTKQDLPEYGPFNEKRQFTPGDRPYAFTVKGRKIGALICEDLWTPTPISTNQKFWTPDADFSALSGLDLLVVLNASPYQPGKIEKRLHVATRAARNLNAPVLYVNQVGGHDELLFDGASFAVSPTGAVTAQAGAFVETNATAVLEGRALNPVTSNFSAELSDEECANLYNAIILYIRDYAAKNGFASAVEGMSGGIDSALMAALACDALGAENVHLFMLASGITSQTSRDDAAETARRLGCHYSEELTITAAYEASKKELTKRSPQPRRKITHENLQARLRTMFLYALSNDEGHLVLNTSNKSETMTGHATFLGDTNGGIAPIKDLWKTQVRALVRWRNANIPALSANPVGNPIVENILKKEPTPELAEGEVDADILPTYEVLDPVGKALVEDEKSKAEIARMGFDPAVVDLIERKLRTVEHKRHQMPPGPSLSRRAFTSREWKYPVTNGFREGLSPL